MKRIQAILSLDMENLPANFQDILRHEKQVVEQWKEAGFLEHLYLREGKDGAVLIFKDLDEIKVQQLMEQLPLYQLKKRVDYYSLILQF